MEKETIKTKKTKVAKVKDITSSLIIAPRITEKAAKLSEKNVYTFTVKESANKTELKKEIQKLYKVTPVRINTTNIADKMKNRRGRLSVKRGAKKAVVFLKKGEKIAFA